MTASSLRSDLGRYVFGVAVLAGGVVMLVWPDYNNWVAPKNTLNGFDGPIFVCATAAAQIIGGFAMLVNRTAKTGAAIVAAVCLLLALACIPQIIAAPVGYINWGNFFYPFSLAVGAAIVYARRSPKWSPETIDRWGRILTGICSVSFCLEQALYLGNSIPLVPKWLPPSQMFWAVATCVPFALAAIALFVNRMALLATRLLTLMIVIFGVVVWVRLLFSDPHSLTNWSECTENFAIAGASWILADFLAEFYPTGR